MVLGIGKAELLRFWDDLDKICRCSTLEKEFCGSTKMIHAPKSSMNNWAETTCKLR